MTALPPRVQAHVVPRGSQGVELSQSSVAVELCLFRLCDWTSADVRASTRDDRDEAYRDHLRDEHGDDLVRLGGLGVHHCSTCECIDPACGYVVGSPGCVETHEREVGP